MNTSTEYQLIKATYEIVKNDKCKESMTFKEIHNHQKNQIKAHKDLKQRLFIIKLNLRPATDPKDNYNQIIKQLKHNPLNPVRNLYVKTYELRKKDMIEILKLFKYDSKKIDEPPYYKGQKGPYMNVYKKEALQDMLNQNNIEWKKTWSIKKLFNAVWKM